VIGSGRDRTNDRSFRTIPAASRTAVRRASRVSGTTSPG